MPRRPLKVRRGVAPAGSVLAIENGAARCLTAPGGAGLFVRPGAPWSGANGEQAIERIQAKAELSSEGPDMPALVCFSDP